MKINKILKGKFIQKKRNIKLTITKILYKCFTQKGVKVIPK